MRCWGQTLEHPIPTLAAFTNGCIGGESQPSNGNTYHGGSLMTGPRRTRRSENQTSFRILLTVVALLTGVLAILVLAAFLVDDSPLADLPDSIAVARDIPYGPNRHHTMDIAYTHPSQSPSPAILMIHQGGWNEGDKSAYHDLMTHYAQLGYITVSINFRPAGEAPFPAAFLDCRRAIRWLRMHASSYGLDPARIGVTGWSAGAHLAMLLALSDDEPDGEDQDRGVSSRVQAAVCVSGVYDFLMEARGPFANNENDPVVIRFLGGTPRQKRDLAKRASPVTHLTSDDPPLLVFHGKMDRTIDVEQARQFKLALEAIGRKDEVILLQDANHGRDVLPGDSKSRDLVRQFFAFHLQPEANSSK